MSNATLRLGGSEVEIKLHEPVEQNPATSQTPAVTEGPAKKPAEQTKKPRARKPRATKTPAKKPAAEKKPRVKKPRAPKPEAVQPKAVATEAAVAAQEPPEPAPDDSLGGLFLAGETLDGIDVMGGIARADKILTNTRAIRIFVDAIGKVEALAIHELKFGNLESVAKQTWYALSFAQVENQIRTWASAGDKTAKGTMAVFAEIRKIADMVDAIKPLWEFYCEVVRPAKDVRSFHELGELMKKLDKAKVVEVFVRRNPPEHAILVGNTAYVPARERGENVPMADAGWPFLQEAEKRAIQGIEVRKTRTQELKNSADKLTAAQARAGKEGAIYLEVSDSKGAMALVRKTREGMQVRINQAVGLPLHSTGWMNWDTANWPDPGLFRAFQKWMEQK